MEAAAMASGVGLSASGCLGFHYVNATIGTNRAVIRQEDFGEQRYVLIDVPALPLPLYVYRNDDGSYTTVSTRCMHQGCQVEPVAGHLVCPCHGSEYTNDGSVLRGPTRLPLERYHTEVDGEDVVIHLVTA
jgi:cytochrome b6-f complex iron-sulfur subunit